MLNKLRKMKNKENKVNKEIENITKNQAENLELNIQNWTENSLEGFNTGFDQAEKVIVRFKERSFEIIHLKEQKEKKKKKGLHKSEGSLKDLCAQSLHLCQTLQLCLLFESPWTVAHQTPLSMWILQARILEWVALSSSRESSWQGSNQCLLCYLHW